MSQGLLLLAARMLLGEVGSDELPDEAARLLADGVDFPLLRELAGQDRSDSERSRSLLEGALAEAGRTTPTLDEARRLLVQEWARDIAEERRAPYAACRDIWIKAWNVGDEDADLTPFAALATDWEESDPESRQEIEADMRDAALAYLGRA